MTFPHHRDRGRRDRAASRAELAHEIRAHPSCDRSVRRKRRRRRRSTRISDTRNGDSWVPTNGVREGTRIATCPAGLRSARLLSGPSTQADGRSLKRADPDARSETESGRLRCLCCGSSIDRGFQAPVRCVRAWLSWPRHGSPRGPAVSSSGVRFCERRDPSRSDGPARVLPYQTLTDTGYLILMLFSISTE